VGRDIDLRSRNQRNQSFVVPLVQRYVLHLLKVDVVEIAGSGVHVSPVRHLYCSVTAPTFRLNPPSDAASCQKFPIFCGFDPCCPPSRYKCPRADRRDIIAILVGFTTRQPGSLRLVIATFAFGTAPPDESVMVPTTRRRSLSRSDSRAPDSSSQRSGYQGIHGRQTKALIVSQLISKK